LSDPKYPSRTVDVLTGFFPVLEFRLPFVIVTEVSDVPVESGPLEEVGVVVAWEEDPPSIGMGGSNGMEKPIMCSIFVFERKVIFVFELAGRVCFVPVAEMHNDIRLPCFDLF
jgi:hypothetical protein